MFPRNIRRLYPWKISQILALLNQHLQFKLWSGNQSLQDQFCKALEKSSLKRPGTQYDPNSGGPRTYFSQLKCLGLIFERPGKSIHLTLAGKDLSNGEPPLPILSHLVLNHQYPSVYGNLQNVKLNPYVRIKPFLFILELLDRKEIGYLKNEEMAIPVVYGHNRNCLQYCVEKIILMRSGKSLKNLIDNKYDLYLPRSKNTSKDAKIKNILDIANTCKNYLQGCCLITIEKEDRTQLIKFNEDVRAIYEKSMNQVDKFIPLGSVEESFQRAYGSWNRQKDTRYVGSDGPKVLRPEESIILSSFYQLCGENVISNMPDNFVVEMVEGYGFSRDQVEDVIYPHLDKTLDFFESTFIELSTGGMRKAIEFEKSICSLFRDKLHFHSTHTGQLKNSERGSGFADVFLIALDNKHCAIIDGKASPNYTLPSSDYRAMTYDYIPNYRELTKGKPYKLEFASYIAGGFSGNISSGLKRITNQTNVNCSAIKAKELLEISKKYSQRKDQEKVRSIFRNNGLIKSHSI